MKTFKYKSIIFDLDGTLADTDEIIIRSFQHVYRTYLGKEMSHEYIYQTFGETLDNVFKMQFPDHYEEALNTYRQYHIEHFDRYVRLYPEAEEMVQWLWKNNIQLGIATSRMANTAHRILEMFHIKNCFKSIITADDCHHHKPHPEPLLKCLEKLGAKKEETVYIGDTKFDLKSAKRAGIDFCYVQWGKIDFNIEQEKPEYILKNWRSLKELLLLTEAE